MSSTNSAAPQRMSYMPSHHPPARPSVSRGRAPSAKSGYAANFFGPASSNTDAPSVSVDANRDFSSSDYDRTQGTVVGLQYFRARYYYAELGRFISRDDRHFSQWSALNYIDPMGIYPDGLNFYAGYFVPSMLDPSGRETYAECVAAIDNAGKKLSKFLKGKYLPNTASKIVKYMKKVGLQYRCGCLEDTPKDKEYCWKDDLPECPLTEDGIDDSWSKDPDAAIKKYHPGAKACYRKTAEEAHHQDPRWGSDLVAGQQCCYDCNGKLITTGAGAGTPDVCSSEESVILHLGYDVIPFDNILGHWELYHEFGWSPDNPPGAPENAGCKKKE